MNLLKFAVKNLAHRTTRTSITVLSIGLAIAVLFTITSFNTGYENSLRGQIQKMGIHMMVVPIGCPYEAASLILKGGRIPSYLPDSLLGLVQRMEGIDIAAGVLIHGIVKPEEGRTDIYIGIDEQMLALKNWWQLEGAFLARENDVILGYDVSLIEVSKVGDQIYLPEYDRTFDVVGVLQPTGTEDDGFFYIRLTTAQEVFKVGNKITGINIRLKDPSQASVLAKTLENLPGAEVITMSELLGTMLSLVGTVRTLILSVVIIIVAISTFGVLNTILMSVFERVREIGIMMATGAGRIHVFVLIWLESVMLSLMGGALGLLMALFASRSIESVVKRFLPLAPRESVVSLRPGVFLFCLVFILLVGIIAGIYPAYFASRQNPAQALRTE